MTIPVGVNASCVSLVWEINHEAFAWVVFVAESGSFEDGVTGFSANGNPGMLHWKDWGRVPKGKGVGEGKPFAPNNMRTLSEKKAHLKEMAETVTEWEICRRDQNGARRMT